MCLPSFEAESETAFIPFSRIIDSVCVVTELIYNLRTLNGKKNVVTVVVPLNVKSHEWRYLISDATVFSSLNPRGVEVNLGCTHMLLENFHKCHLQYIGFILIICGILELNRH